jgi:quercetin dioxygenase-like cupin family protein
MEVLIMFCYHNDAIPIPCEEGVTRRILSYSEDLMMCEITFEKGAEGNVHSHPHLQITYIVKGSFLFTIDGEAKVIKAGDSVYMPANSVHGTVALEDSVLVDVFNPKRDDFLN